MGERLYNQYNKVTPKMIEARALVDNFIKATKNIPSYNIIARKLKIDHSTAYYRLRGYRYKMKERCPWEVKRRKTNDSDNHN